MHIVRFLDSSGNEQYGERVDEKTARIIEGDLFGDYSVTDQTAPIQKLLAPIVPVSILCLGLNYRYHAEEGGAKIPEYPILFIKAANTLQNPGDPVVIPKLSLIHI